MRFLARPLGVFFFSCLSTFGVCDLTLPARARDPWTVHQYSVNDVRSDEEGGYCTFSHIVLEVGVVDGVDDEKWLETVQFDSLEFRSLPNMRT